MRALTLRDVAFPRTSIRTSTFDPLTLSPYRWYDFSDADSVTLNGSTVSQLDDKSGNDQHLTQGTGSAQPTYTVAAQAGRNVGTFDGGDNLTRATQTIAQPFAMFIVLKTTALGSQDNYFGGFNSVFYRTSGNVWALYANSVLSSGVTDDNDWHVFTAVFNGASSYLRMDGTQIASGNAGGGGLSSQTLALGSDAFSANYMVGQIGTAMLAPVPSDTLRDDMEADLLYLWDLA